MDDENYSHTLYFTLKKEDEAFSRSGKLAFNDDIVPLLLERLPQERYLGNTICDAIDINVKLILANEEVSFSDCKRFERNDLLFSGDLSFMKSGRYQVVLGNKYIFESNYKAGQIILEKLMNEIEQAFEDEDESLLEDEEDHEVSEEEAEFEDEDGEDDVVEGGDSEDEMTELNGSHKGIDALPVKLAFEVGQKTIKVGNLKTLQPGFTFKMDNPVDMPIVIRANGEKIAAGELVQVGDEIGVRITRFT